MATTLTGARHETALPASSLFGNLLDMKADQKTERTAYTCRYHPTIAEIDRDAWMRLAPDDAEGWDYHRAMECTKGPFSYGALAVYDNHLALVAVVPVFHLDYRLDTSLGESFKAVGDWIGRALPYSMRVPVIGLGSPMTERCRIFFDSGLIQSVRQIIVGLVLDELRKTADATGARVLALKDVSESDGCWMHETLAAAGFARMASLPVAKLRLPFADDDAYLASLPGKVRSDLRRKMRLARDVTVEFPSSIEDVYDTVLRLYRETHAHRKASYDSFDEVPEEFFRAMMRTNDRARIMICRVAGEIASFNLFFEEPNRVIGKFIGMNYELSRKNNLYFINWMQMVRYCTERGITELQTGQTTYQLKTRLGCSLEKSWIYFRHKNNVLNSLFKAVGPHMGLDKADPDLRALGSKANYEAEAA